MAADKQTDPNRTRREGADATNLLHDRRRPGRIKDPNPALINLMRATPNDGASTLLNDPLIALRQYTDDTQDDLHASRGILTAFGLSIVLWSVLLLGGWLAYRYI